MPLIQTQIDYINSCIEHFFEDLPTTEMELRAKIDDFEKVFLKQLPASHELFNLQNCLHQPTLYLRRLEESNPDISIGEVQTYVFQHIQQQLETHATHLQFGWDNTYWNPLLDSFKEKAEYQKIFRSDLLPIDDIEYTHPYFIEPAGRMFKACLNPIKRLRKVKMITTVMLAEEIEKTSTLADFPNDLYSDYDGSRFDAFMETLPPLAEQKAQKKAKKIIWRDLKKQLELPDDVEISDAAKILLTYSIYYQAIKNKTLPLSTISNITDTQLATLVSPTIINRINHKEYSIEEALQLTVAEKNIVLTPFYYEGMRSGMFHFARDFKGLNEEESFNLTIPVIIHLIKATKLTVKQARNIPIYARLIIADEFYFQLIKQASQEYADLLIHPTILILIDKKIIVPNQLTPHIAKLLVENSYVRYFVEHGFLNPAELPHISFNKDSSPDIDYNFNPFIELDHASIKAVIENFLLHNQRNILMCADLKCIYHHLPELCALTMRPSLDILENENIYVCSKKNISLRLQALLEDQPKTLVDGTQDSFHTLSTDCQQFRIRFEKILDVEIERRLHLFLLGNNSVVNPVIKHKTILNLKPLHLQELYFAQRCWGIYQNRGYIIEGKEDSLPKIQSHFEEAAVKQRIPTPYLRTAIMRRSLQLLRIYIDEQISKQEYETCSIYKKIRDIIISAENASKLKKEESWRLAPWKKAFDQVIAVALQEKPNVNFLNSNIEQYAKRQCRSITLFAIVPKTSLQMIKDLCDWVIDLSGILELRSSPNPCLNNKCGVGR